jgi:hypothetical protein
VEKKDWTKLVIAVACFLIGFLGLAFKWPFQFLFFLVMVAGPFGMIDATVPVWSETNIAKRFWNFIILRIKNSDPGVFAFNTLINMIGISSLILVPILLIACYLSTVEFGVAKTGVGLFLMFYVASPTAILIFLVYKGVKALEKKTRSK